MAYISFQPKDYFNTLLYTGTGSTNAVTGVGFQPDMVWSKNRNQTYNHQINDAVRGVNKQLAPNNTNAEETNTGELTAFGSDGFTVGSGGTLNGNGDGIVSWNWLANGQGSSNTDGDITSTVSANQTAGFSIVTHTGTGSTATIGHGLGAVPKVIITKKRSAADNWFTYHHSIGNGKYLLLEATDAEATSSNVWNDTSPTSSVFTRGGPANDSGATYVQYCFAEKKGFSKFGSYQGNSNADGAFVYTGFKPAWVMIKQATGGNANEVWSIRDNKRDTDNPITKSLVANANSAEGTTSTHFVDFLSNGFKIRTGTENSLNTNYGYIFMAFAEAPLVGSNNIPATAR